MAYVVRLRNKDVMQGMQALMFCCLRALTSSRTCQFDAQRELKVVPVNWALSFRQKLINILLLPVG